MFTAPMENVINGPEISADAAVDAPIRNLSFQLICLQMSLKANYPGAFKKIMLYGSLPLFLFWGYTPPSLLESQPLIHGTVGAVGRVALKYTVDKDIKTKLGTAVYGKPKESQAYALA